MEVDSQEEGKKEFHCYEEAWELEARKNSSVNHFRMEEKLVGVYFYDNDPGEGEEAEHYLIHALFWPKNARGAGRVWRADCTKVVQNAGSGEWVPHVGESGEPQTQDYYVNDGLLSDDRGGLGS